MILTLSITNELNKLFDQREIYGSIMICDLAGSESGKNLQTQGQYINNSLAALREEFSNIIKRYDANINKRNYQDTHNFRSKLVHLFKEQMK